MAPKTKEQKTAESGSINDPKEGDFLGPYLGLDPVPGADSVATSDPAAGSPSGYIAVVVTGATLKHNGKEYPHSHTVKLQLKTAERLTAIGLVKPLSVMRQELEAKEKVGLAITINAGGVEIITGG